jgi:hypothetical protein
MKLKVKLKMMKRFQIAAIQEHIELTDDNNQKANFKEIKLNENNRKNEKENKDDDDGMSIMKKISQQYATLYSQNSYKRYESVMNDENIKQKLLELQSTLKTQIDELKLLKSQQQEPGMFFSPQMGFQASDQSISVASCR